MRTSRLRAVNAVLSVLSLVAPETTTVPSGAIRARAAAGFPPAW